MVDYISREAAINEIDFQSRYYDAEWGAKRFATEDVQEILQSIPAADVRPVVHGEWKYESGDGKTCVDGWVCTNCNCGFHTNVPYFEGFNFCPNCGADMREVTANGN